MINWKKCDVFGKEAIFCSPCLNEPFCILLLDVPVLKYLASSSNSRFKTYYSLFLRVEVSIDSTKLLTENWIEYLIGIITYNRYGYAFHTSPPIPFQDITVPPKINRVLSWQLNIYVSGLSRIGWSCRRYSANEETTEKNIYKKHFR